MKIYAVKYSTGYDYDEFVSYHQSEEDAQERANQLNKDNPGLDAHVEDIELE
jgi:hypothetical protein